MILVRVDPKTGKYRILDRAKEMVRLGEDSGGMKHISEQAIQRGLITLQRFKKIYSAKKAVVRAVATSAVREARNQAEFIHRVKTRTGINIQVISGFEEARLIYLGALQALPIFEKRVLLIDIGGGSTEFLVGEKGQTLYSNSLKLGAVRLTGKFFKGGKFNSRRVKECRKHIKGNLVPVVRDVRKRGYELAVGISGTILNLGLMVALARKGRRPASLNNFSFSRDELCNLVRKIARCKSVSELKHIPGLDPARADIISAGALILEQAFKAFNIKQMTISEFALREGTALDTINKKFTSAGKKMLHDLRWHNILEMAKHFDYEPRHSHQVAALSLSLFDQTKKLHRLGHAEREYLEYAAILHDIGLFISHAQHHLHTYYLVRNAELLGFTEAEKEIIANIARYHRKSHPHPRHEGFNNLDDQEQEMVLKLALILRIADGLDRSHTGSVKKVVGKIKKKEFKCRLSPSNSHSLEPEIWGADRKKQLFEQTYSKRLVLAK